MDRIIMAFQLLAILSQSKGQIQALQPGQMADVVTFDENEYIHLFGVGVNIAISVQRPPAVGSAATTGEVNPSRTINLPGEG